MFENGVNWKKPKSHILTLTPPDFINWSQSQSKLTDVYRRWRTVRFPPKNLGKWLGNGWEINILQPFLNLFPTLSQRGDLMRNQAPL